MTHTPQPQHGLTIQIPERYVRSETYLAWFWSQIDQLDYRPWWVAFRALDHQLYVMMEKHAKALWQILHKYVPNAAIANGLKQPAWTAPFSASQILYWSILLGCLMVLMRASQLDPILLSAQ